jgi:uncharacterized protein YgiM (DUF1202 family)
VGLACFCVGLYLATVDPSEAVDALPHATVIAPGLNLRGGPGVTYAPLAVMPQGLRVTVVRHLANGWDEVIAPGPSGSTIRGFASHKMLATKDP